MQIASFTSSSLAVLARSIMFFPLDCGVFFIVTFAPIVSTDMYLLIDVYIRIYNTLPFDKLVQKQEGTSL